MMTRALLDILVCPKCQCDLEWRPSDGGSTPGLDGELRCRRCPSVYAVRGGVPRFIPSDDYAASFGMQWNRFSATQLDSATGTDLSAARFYSETGWERAWLPGKLVMEGGSGAGRFLEIAGATGATVIGVDMSSAVDAARASLAHLPNVHLVQASLYELPFRPGTFDGCYCIGVIQHTPDPAKALAALPRVLKDGGRVAITAYERKRWTRWHGKYLLRPITRRMPRMLLLRSIQWSMPILFPLTEVLFRLPFLGRVFRFVIPVANYTRERNLTMRERYRWAILDTFDMFSPAFDQPPTEQEVVTALTGAGIANIRRLPNAGLNVVGTKAHAAAEASAVAVP
jgi:SAM-dependent methyltransferase